MKIRKIDIYRIVLTLFLIRQIFLTRVYWPLDEQGRISSVSKIFIVLILIFSVFLYIWQIWDSQDYIYYLVIVPLIVMILILSYLRIKSYDIMLSIFLILLSKDIEYRKIVKIYFWVTLLIFVGVVILSFTGITTDWVVSFGYGVGHSMGFSHPNNFGIIVLSLLLAWIYLHSELQWKFIFPITTLAGFVVWEIAAARTSAIIMIATPWIIGIQRLSEKLNFKWIFRFEILMIIVAWILSFYLMFKFGQKGSSNNFEVRFNMAYWLYEQYGINWLGTKLPLVSTFDAMQLGIRSVILDNAYLRILLLNGILTTIMMLGIYMIIAYRGYKAHNFILLVVLALFVVEGFMEQFSLYAEFNFILLAAFAKLDNKNVKHLSDSV